MNSKSNPDKNSGKDKPAQEKQPITLTKAEAAKKVKRMVAVIDPETKQPKCDKDNQIVSKPQAIKEEEVMSHAVYEDKNLVVVVTTAGEKLSGPLKAEK